MEIVFGVGKCFPVRRWHLQKASLIYLKPSSHVVHYLNVCVCTATSCSSPLRTFCCAFATPLDRSIFMLSEPHPKTQVLEVSSSCGGQSVSRGRPLSIGVDAKDPGPPCSCNIVSSTSLSCLLSLSTCTITCVGIVGFVGDPTRWRNGRCCHRYLIHPQHMRLGSDDPYELGVSHSWMSCVHAIGKMQKPVDRSYDAHRPLRRG